jgi:hypothetical protein
VAGEEAAVARWYMGRRPRFANMTGIFFCASASPRLQPWGAVTTSSPERRPARWCARSASRASTRSGAGRTVGNGRAGVLVVYLASKYVRTRLMVDQQAGAALGRSSYSLGGAPGQRCSADQGGG